MAKFLNTIHKAKDSCKTTGEAVSNHFVDVTKTIKMPKSATKEVPDFMLTRYACYLIAQNGDPKKEQIALKLERRVKALDKEIAKKNLKGKKEIEA